MDKRKILKNFIKTGKVIIKDVAFLLALKNYKVEGKYFTQIRYIDGGSEVGNFSENEVYNFKGRHIEPTNEKECMILKIER